MSIDNLDLCELVMLSKSGDMDAYAKLYAMTYPTLYNVAMTVCTDSYEAQDGVQDAYLRIYNSLPSLAKPEHFTTWAKRITYNICLRRMSRKRDLLSGDIVSVSDSTVDSVPSPEYYLETTERQDALIDAIDKLPDKYQEVFKLKNYEQHSVLEIAKILNCPEGTVKSRLSTARKLIIKNLKKHGQFYSIGMWLYPASAFVPLQTNIELSRAGLTTIGAAAGVTGIAAGSASSLSSGSNIASTTSTITSASSSNSVGLITRMGQYGSQLASASTVTPIVCGVAATVAVGGVAVSGVAVNQNILTDNTADVIQEEFVSEAFSDDVSASTPPDTDSILPVMRDHIAQGGIFTAYVEDSDSGINFEEIYGILSDGSTLNLNTFDSTTGYIEFLIPDQDFTLYISDNFGNIQDYIISVTTK